MKSVHTDPALIPASLSNLGIRLIYPLLILSSCCLGGLPVYGQTDEVPAHLVFDPVAIDVESDEENGQVIHEITQLPSSAQPQTLDSLIADHPVSSTQETDDSVQKDISRYQDSVAELEVKDGPYDAGLVQELVSLGTIYQHQGEHAKAIELFDRAAHINRVNYGLFNLDQVPIIELSIRSHLALGELIEADNQQEYLFYIQQKAYGAQSTKLLPALSNLAEWNIYAFNAHLDPNPGGFAGSDAKITDPSLNTPEGLDNFRSTRLVNAQNLYNSIIQIILNNFGIGDPRLLDAEKKLALTNYFFATNFNAINDPFINSGGSYALQNTAAGLDGPVGSNTMGYRHGRDALERRIKYLQEAANPDNEAIARAMVELGDWHLVFKKRSSALELYQQAYDLLHANNASVDVLKADLQPDVPVELPTLITPRFSRAFLNIPQDTPLQYQGYVDIEFTLNRYGQTGKVDVLDTSDAAPEAIKDELVDHIRRSQYRPRFDQGVLREEDLLQLRYYYAY